MKTLTCIFFCLLIVQSLVIAQKKKIFKKETLYKIETTERKTYYVKIIEFEKEVIKVADEVGSSFTIPMKSIYSFREFKAGKRKSDSFNGTDLSHYFFSAPAINLKAKESVLSFQVPLYFSYTYGVTDKVSIEAGSSPLGFLVNQPAFFLASKINLVAKDNFHLGIAASYLTVLADGSIPSASVLLSEVKATFGSLYKNLTLSLSVPSSFGAAEFNSPVVSLSGQWYLGLKTSLVYELYYADVIRLFNNENVDSVTSLLYGLRTRKRRHSFDFGVGLFRSRIINSSNQMMTAFYPYVNYNLDLK
ncbi:MAG: hypothetical protein AAFQ94_11880 [Bacteroidota bacterium]